MNFWEWTFYFCAAVGVVSITGAVGIVVCCIASFWWDLAREGTRCPGWGVDGDGREAPCLCEECVTR